MKSKRNIVLMWSVSLMPVIILTAIYGRMPETVPTSFGFDGTINAYGPKYTLWMMAGMGPLLALLFQFIPRIDPLKRNYAKFQRYYDTFTIALELFLLGLDSMLFIEILRPGTVSIGRAVTVLICLLFLIMGNMMGKIRHNYFFGIRTPWTLADPDVWNRTHRAGGWMYFVIGLVLLPCCLLLPEKVFFVLLMAGVLGSTAALLVLSYLWYRGKHMGK